MALLDQPDSRTRAIRRLEQYFEDALTKAAMDLSDPDVRRVVDASIEPLTRTYVQHAETLEPRVRVALCRLLSAFADKRAAPAFQKAFEDFVKRAPTSKDDADVKWAARGVTALKLDSLAMPLLDVFVSFRASTQLGGVSYLDLNRAMVAIADKAWVQQLIRTLEPPIPPSKDPATVDAYRDQTVWQVTAAEVLGHVRDPQAIEPLLGVMLDPAKVELHATAVTALIRIGRPVVPPAVQLLEGRHRQLVAFSASRVQAQTGKPPRGAPHAVVAAVVLGVLGRTDAAAALIAAAGREKDPGTKAVIARELARLPPSDETKAAFKRAYETFKVDDTTSAGGNALDELTEAASALYDSTLVDWLLQRATVVRGQPEDVARYRAGVLLTALRLARTAQLPVVEKAVAKYGQEPERQLYAQTESLLTACNEDVACYLAALRNRENYDHRRQFIAIKAAYMLGLLGGESTRSELLASIDSLDNAALRAVAARTIDQLSPRRDAAVVAELATIVAKNAASPDRERAARDAPIKTVMLRIDARD